MFTGHSRAMGLSGAMSMVLLAHAMIAGAAGPAGAPVLEPVYRLAGPGSGERLVTREQLAETKRKIPDTPPAFLVAITEQGWPGLVPVFAAGKDGSFELHRRPRAGEENSSEPLFFALPSADEPDAGRIAGPWQCVATRATGTKSWFTCELAAEGTTVAGRFDPGTDFRVATIAGGTFRSNRLELRVEYQNNVYLLTGEWRAGKLRGTWRETNDEERGEWEGERESRLAGAALPPGDVVPLFEWRQGREHPPRYLTGTNSPGPGWTRTVRAVCRVWKTIPGMLTEGIGPGPR